MKTILLLSTLLMSASVLLAQQPAYDKYYTGAPFKMNKVVQPVFAKNTVNITDFGGVGDGITKNTQSFAKAIDVLAGKGGGRLVVPRGVWLTGPIHLKSNINLHVEAGAVILFSRDFSDYPIIETSFEGIYAVRATSPIMGVKLTNIAITGDGIIDGNGDAWRPVKREKMTEGQWSNLKKIGVTDPADRLWFPTEGARYAYLNSEDFHRIKLSELTPQQVEDYKPYYRPVMVSLVSCKNVLLSGVTFQNSPAWNVHPLMCENLTVDNVNIRNPWYSQNGDGIDIESCANVLVVNSSFDVGDDAICIKSGKDKEGRDRGMPTKNLIVENCIVYHGHGGFVVGSEMSGGVNNAWVKNCTFIGTDVGLRFKSTRGRGGLVENIWIEGIDMLNIPNQALLFDLFYGKADPNAPLPAVTEETPSFRNIFIKNVTCRGAGTAMLFNGLPEMNVMNVTVDDVVMQATRGIIVNYSDNVKFRNVTVIPSVGDKIEVSGSKNIDTAGIK